MINKLSYLAGIILCVLSFNSRAADLNLIREFKETAEKYTKYSIELTEQTSKLQLLKNCEKAAFDQKFEKVFKTYDISFSAQKTALGKVLLISSPCTNDLQNIKLEDNNILKLAGLIKSYQISSAAWLDLYKGALTTASQTNSQAKKELLKFQKAEQEKLEFLQKSLEKAKGNNESMKKLAFNAVMVIGYVAFFMALTSIGVPALLTVFGITNGFAGMTGAFAAGLISVIFAGAVAADYGADKVRQLDEVNIARQQILSEIADRTETLKGSQRYINALAGQDEAQNINQLF